MGTVTGGVDLLRGGDRMGTYLNPGNLGFAEILADQYVDKTGMIEVINGASARGGS